VKFYRSLLNFTYLDPLQLKGIEISVVYFYLPISSANHIFDHLLESSHRDDSNKWSNILFGDEITQIDSIKVNFINLIWSSESASLTVMTYIYYKEIWNTSLICLNVLGCVLGYSIFLLC